jgi:hypothetical protein
MRWSNPVRNRHDWPQARCRRKDHRRATVAGSANRHLRRAGDLFLVAVRGLVRSIHSNFGFEPQNTLLVETALSMAGYTTDTIAGHAKTHD